MRKRHWTYTDRIRLMFGRFLCDHFAWEYENALSEYYGLYVREV